MTAPAIKNRRANAWRYTANSSTSQPASSAVKVNHGVVCSGPSPWRIARHWSDVDWSAAGRVALHIFSPDEFTCALITAPPSTFHCTCTDSANSVCNTNSVGTSSIRSDCGMKSGESRGRFSGTSLTSTEYPLGVTPKNGEEEPP